jgi:hypothetical protein
MEKLFVQIVDVVFVVGSGGCHVLLHLRIIPSFEVIVALFTFVVTFVLRRAVDDQPTIATTGTSHQLMQQLVPIDQAKDLLILL